MNPRLTLLTELATVVQRRPPVDQLLQMVVDYTAQIMDVEHSSVRLLDPTRNFLVAACRSGDRVMASPMEFRRGEGLLGWIVEQGEPLCLA